MMATFDGLKSSWVGNLMYYCLPYRKKIVMSNIRQVFGDSLTGLETQALAKAFYAHLACSIKENIMMRFMSQAQIKARAKVLGYEKVMELAKKNKGIIILTGHFGNWEFSPIAGIANFEEFKGRFHFIRKTLGNKYLERFLFKRYYQAGLKVIPKKNSLNQVCDVLDKNHAVVFVMDQHACLSNRDGIEVEFFGKKAGTYRSLATLARYTGAPVVPAASYRQANGQHVLEFFDPLPWLDYESIRDAIYYNTLAYNQALEKMILAHPEQWLWLHKRWKL